MKRLGQFLIILLLCLLLSACWNRRELNELGIQMGTAIDKVGDQYQVTVQVVVPAEVSARLGSGRSPVTMYKATAPTVFEAFRKLTETSPRKIYSAHIRVLILGESLAKEGIANALDMLSRNPEARTDYYILIARQVSAENALKVLTSLEKIPAHNLYYSLDTSAKNWSPTTTVTMDQFIDQLVSEGINPVLTGVEMIGNLKTADKKINVEETEPSALLRTIGLAVFKKDQLIGWLNNEESKGYNYIMDNVKSTVGHVACPDGKLLALETIRTQTKLKGRIENGEPIINISVINESNVGDVECNIDLTDPKTLDMLQRKAEDHLTSIIKKTIDNVREKYKVDIFGFGQAIYRSDPKEWKRLKPDWETYFARLKVEYSMKVTIRRVGTTNNTFKNFIKE